LAQRGYTPIVLDNLSTGHESFVKWGPLVLADIADSIAVANTINKYKLDSVIHFAASAYVGESVHNPRKYFDNNVQGTLALLGTCLDNGVSNFVFSSSCATYGIPQHMPILETTPQNPINPYGYTKLVIERALQEYSRAYGLRTLALRYFNAAGAIPSLEIGERHYPETHLIPLIFRSMFDPSYALKIFGSDYPTPDGTCIRDYIHVLDLAEAHVLGLEKLKSGQISNAAVNLGTSEGHSVKAVLSCAERITQLKAKVEIAERRPGDPPELVANANLARALLGWSAQQSSLENIIETAWNWQKKNMLKQ
jgi:UDP-glucose-4-epimerase GalE